MAARLSGNSDEARSFEFFHRELGPAVFDAFNDLAVVNQLTMQLSLSDTIVKHAVVALGSIGEQRMKDKSLSLRTLEHEKNLQFAHLQNVKAIQKLRKHLSCSKPQSIELTLVSCFLFIIFDFFYGDDVGSHAHLKAGLKIVHSCFPVGATGQGTSPKPSPIIQDFARIFTVMDLHAAIWLGPPSFQSPPLVDISYGILGEQPIGFFGTLGDACESLNFQLMRVYVYHHSITAYESNPYAIGAYLRVPSVFPCSQQTENIVVRATQKHLVIESLPGKLTW